MRLLAAATLLLAATANAHDFWIEPSTFTPAAGETVAIRLRVGEHLKGEPVPRRAARIERFFATSDSGTREVPGQNDRDPAGVVAIRDAGTTVVAYRSRPTRTELAAETFESYLREEGLEQIIERRNGSTAPASEIYSRAAKTLLQSVGGQTRDRALGLRLELVRDGNAFQVLFEGKPLRDALVVALRRGAEPLRARSDADGRVTFANLGKGEWLVKTVHMIPAPPATNAEWESIWASLTFAVR